MDTVKYPHLFAPLRIRGVYFRNRLFSAPQGFYNDGPERYPSEAAVAFYERKAVGGFASVSVGDCIVDAKTGKGLPWTRDMEDIENLNHMSKIAHAVTRSGAVASAELSHDGMFSNYSKMTYGTKLYGPTAGEYRYGRVEEMPEEMILDLADKFGKAAAFAKQCGFNMITIHAGHGWLLHQFMSHIFNHRTDRWGGSFENRMRFPLLVIDSIRKAVGEDTPIEFRFSGTEIDERGYGIDEGVRIAQAVDGKVDIIHVSVGLHEIDETFIVVHPSMFLEDGCNSKYAREIKKNVSKSLVATVGAFTDPAHMEEFLATGGADIIEVARQTLADPDFPIKARTGREDEIAPCIRCLQCFNNVGEHRIFRCTLNPEIGQELDVKMMPERAAHPKKVLVAGGGVGGMEAAIQAAKMGHTVTLCEKTDRLGGVLNCEEKVPFKKNLGRYLRRQERLLEVNGVTVKLNTPVTPALAEELKPDVIIASLGARPVVPPIPGIEKALLAEDVLMNVESVKGDAVIMGAGQVGLELAIWLAQLGHKATIVEMAEKPGIDIRGVAFMYYGITMDRLGVELKLSTKAVAVNDGSLTVETADGREEIPADTVICAAGQRPLSEEADALAFCAPEFHLIGDCAKPANVLTATRQAYAIARNLGRL
ncbi:MAG: FAD-dependent oxidoreductase [Oscillospiraceae bacterium]|nr:FAD-dependent oxidoreductase [Oscillospiraceae bacterium]